MKQFSRKAAGLFCLCVALTVSVFCQTQHSQKTVVPISPTPLATEPSLAPQKDAATVDQIHEYLELSGDVESFKSRWVAAVDMNRSLGAPYRRESFWTAIKTEMQNTDLTPEYVAIFQHGTSRDLMQEILEAYHRLGSDRFVGSPECFKLGAALLAMNDDMEKLKLAKTSQVIKKVYTAYKPRIRAARVKYQAEHPGWKDK